MTYQLLPQPDPFTTEPLRALTTSEKRGEGWRDWEFALHAEPDRIRVRTGAGKSWHLLTDQSCSCLARMACAHRYGLQNAGGVEMVRKMMAAGVHPRQRCKACRGYGVIMGVWLDKACNECYGKGWRE